MYIHVSAEAKPYQTIIQDKHLLARSRSPTMLGILLVYVHVHTVPVCVHTCTCIVLQCLVNSLFTRNTGMCIVLQITAHWKIGGFFCMSGACSECTRGCPATSSVQTHTAPQRSNTHETSFATTLHNYVMYIVHVCRLCIHVLKAVGRNKNYIHLNMCIQ